MSSGKRWTNNKEINQLLADYVDLGWEVKKSNSPSLKVVPPQEVLLANSDKRPFISVHKTPSDKRSYANLKADFARYVDPRTPVETKVLTDMAGELPSKKSFFCRNCGTTGPEFPTVEQRDQHELEHNLTKTAKHLWGPNNPPPQAGNRQCPFCEWNKSGKVFRRHIQIQHGTEWTAFSLATLTLDALEDFEAPEVVEVSETPSVISYATDTFEAIISILIPDGIRIKNAADVKKMEELKELINSVEALISSFD